MLGVELIPAVLYFIFLYFVPKKSAMVVFKRKYKETKEVLVEIHGEEKGALEITP